MGPGPRASGSPRVADAATRVDRCCGVGVLGNTGSSRRYYSDQAEFPPYRRTFTRRLITRNRQKPSSELEESRRKLIRSADSNVLAPDLATNVTLRSARPEDCADILRLIHDFAELEDSLDQVELTEEGLIRDGFGEMPFYRCVVAEAQGSCDVTSVVAYAMYNFCYCAWKGRMLMWEDIYVHETYRGFGFGALILHQVTKHAYELGCRRISGYVDDNDAKLRRWYQSYGFIDFTRQHDYHIYSLSDNALEKFVTNLNPFTKPKAMGLQVESSI
ncbi:diamine acetyltransferase 1-like [Diadema setosum]|uniref:diamine acetyltransferase 1-like n=1 Tax=Diadema setosum TaxID=31175 RepID=UPI003B3AF5F7